MAASKSVAGPLTGCRFRTTSLRSIVARKRTVPSTQDCASMIGNAGPIVRMGLARVGSDVLDVRSPFCPASLATESE